MSYLRGVAIVPHPPIILSNIGQGEEKQAKLTIDGIEAVAQIVKEQSPETIFCITPHGNVFEDGICILDENKVEGNLAEFGSPNISMEKEVDQDFLDPILKAFVEREIPSVFLSKNLASEYEVNIELDHGTIIPLHFIDQQYRQYKIVHITIGFLDLLELYEIGTILRSVIETVKKKTFILVSGDLSHCLKEGAPSEYNPVGRAFDEGIVKNIQEGNIEEILLVLDEISEGAAECGLRPIAIGLGVLDGYKFQGRVHSYEAPFGVGYLNASLEVLGRGESTLEKLKRRSHIAYLGKKRSESIPVSLARATIEEWVGKGHQLDWEAYQDLILQKDIVLQLEDHKAGVFVSIDKRGNLRGCMGTYIPVHRNIAEEIINNAILAVSEDPRFYPLRTAELKDIEIKVDIIDHLEEIEDIHQLDVQKYGVLVERGERIGLLLPDIKGIETPTEQVRIAKEKAEIELDEEVTLYRFEVQRYL